MRKRGGRRDVVIEDLKRMLKDFIQSADIKGFVRQELENIYDTRFISSLFPG